MRWYRLTALSRLCFALAITEVLPSEGERESQLERLDDSCFSLSDLNSFFISRSFAAIGKKCFQRARTGTITFECDSGVQAFDEGSLPVLC
jgi:hypothetical protein